MINSFDRREFPMVRAILRNGVILPVDPLPIAWGDGRELIIKEKNDPHESPESFERWFQEFDDMCAQSDPVEDERMMRALEEDHEQAKAIMRKHMGLYQ
jgi:hypothetical protein